MVPTSFRGAGVRGAGVTALTVGVLLVTAACSSSPQTPTAAPTTPATTSSPATTSPATTPTGTESAASPSPTSNPTGASSTKPTAHTSATAPPTAVPTALKGRVLTRLLTSRKVVALTFDAGANGDGVDSILKTLAAQKVAGSFFLTGDFVDQFPALSRRMAAAGRVGNHTTTHPHLPTLPEAAVRTQVTGAQATFLRVTGQDPRPLFRFPFGESRPSDVRLVNDLGYLAVGWTVDTLGWQGTSGGQSVSSVVRRVLAAAVPGEIVLMHVGSHPTDHSTLDADSLPRIISGLRAAGYSFVTLDALTAR